MVEKNKRVVAIVGRPNVGKSALFNRLVGRRLSIVHEQSGVTRDRVMAEVIREDERFELVDTGGLGLMDEKAGGDAFEAHIRDQVKIAIEDAAVLVFVVDITAGLAPLDSEVARLLHESGKPVLIAANKADHDRIDAQAVEFEALGFVTYPVSALHGRGVGELMDVVVGHLPTCDMTAIVKPLRVAVVGKPNAGKSSYINRLLRNDRVMVSEVAGTTRDSVEIPFTVGKGEQARHYVLMDTAGIRQKRKVHTPVEKFSVMRAEKSIQLSDVVVHMIDCSTGFGAQDKKISALVSEYRRGCFLLIHKWDLSEATQRAYLKELKPTIPFLHEIPVLFASSKTGYNVRSTIECTTRDSVEIPFTVGKGEQARHYVLMDTAGIRQKRKVHTPVEKFSVMRAEKSIQLSDVVVHMIDCSTGFGAQDKKISALVSEYRRGCFLLIHKWDLSEATQRAYLKELKPTIPFSSLR